MLVEACFRVYGWAGPTRYSVKLGFIARQRHVRIGTLILVKAFHLRLEEVAQVAAASRHKWITTVVHFVGVERLSYA